LRRRLLAVLSVGAMVAALAAGMSPANGASASAPRLRNLDPGGPARYREKVPVNLVFVGYEPDQVHKGSFLAGLPSSSRPVVRSRLLYGITERLGITYTYDYNVSYASSGYEDRFFSTLSRLATPAPLTSLQQQYNDQQHNVLDVTDNHYIDAPTVERWLALHPPAGVDTRRDTIFFVNWYGRPDFKFHVYTKTNEPDPDTALTSGSSVTAARSSPGAEPPPTTRRTGSASCAGSGSTTCRPGPSPGPTTGTSTTPTWTATGWPTTACRRSGSTPGAGSGRRRRCPATCPRWPATSG
jgi:hypothetical protein